MFRFVLLFAVLGGLILLALQNLSPVVLAFLGFNSVALPLGLWVLLALAAGFFSSLLLGSLFGLSNYLSDRQLRSRIGELLAENNRLRQSRSRPSPDRSRSYSTEENSFDREESSEKNDYLEDDEDEEDEEEEVKDSSNTNFTYDRPQVPTATDRSGSVYSYNYQNPSNSAVGKIESVYDAEYRVLTPPYRSSPPADNDWESQKSDSQDDWGLEDEDGDEFDDRLDRPPYR